jgi:hypothetical protein
MGLWVRSIPWVPFPPMKVPTQGHKHASVPSRSLPFFNAKRPKLFQPWHPNQDLHDFSVTHMCGALPIHLKPKVSGDLPLLGQLFCFWGVPVPETVRQVCYVKLSASCLTGPLPWCLFGVFASFRVPAPRVWKLRIRLTNLPIDTTMGTFIYILVHRSCLYHRYHTNPWKYPSVEAYMPSCTNQEVVFMMVDMMAYIELVLQWVAVMESSLGPRWMVCYVKLSATCLTGPLPWCLFGVFASFGVPAPRVWKLRIFPTNLPIDTTMGKFIYIYWSIGHVDTIGIIPTHESTLQWKHTCPHARTKKWRSWWWMWWPTLSWYCNELRSWNHRLDHVGWCVMWNWVQLAWQYPSLGVFSVFFIRELGNAPGLGRHYMCVCPHFVVIPSALMQTWRIFRHSLMYVGCRGSMQPGLHCFLS